MRKKKVVIITLLLIEIICIFLMYKSYAFQEKEIPKVKVKENAIDNERMAIMLEENVGLKDYMPSDRKKWPQEGFIYNEENSGCSNSQGEEIKDAIKYDRERNEVSLKVNVETYCYLYFDKIDVEGNYKFYIKEEKEWPKYTNTTTNDVVIEYEEENIESYCVSEEDNSGSCVWNKTDGKKRIETTYKFEEEQEGEKVVYAYIKDSEKVTRKVSDKIILDTTNPTISEFTITGSSGSSTGYSQTAMPSGYTIIANDNGEIQSDIAYYCVMSTNNSTDCNWQTSVENLPKISLGNEDGTITQYAFVKDEAGNISEEKSAKIILDMTNPTISAFTITGSSGSPSGYSYTTAITAYSITASDTNGIASYCVSSTNSSSGCTWKTAVGDITKIALTGDDGEKTQYAFVKDKAGRVSAVKSGKIILDTTNPTISEFTITGSSGSSTGYSKTTSISAYSITASDTNGIASYCVSSTNSSSGCTWKTAVGDITKIALTGDDGEKTQYAFVKDKAGRVSAVKSGKIILDTTNPTISAFTITGSSGSSTGYSQTTLISAYSITASDTNGIASYCVSSTNSSSDCTWKATVSDITKIALTGDDGEKTQYAFVKDKAGRVSTVKSAKIILDTTNPTISAFTITGSSGSNKGYSRTTSISSYSITASDTNGIASYCVSSTNSSSGCTWKTTVSDITKIALTGDDGEKTQYAFVKDKAGRVSAVKSGKITLDREVPKNLKMNFVDGDFNTYVSDTWSTRYLYAARSKENYAPTGEDVTSGIDYYEISTNNTSWTKFEYSVDKNDDDLYAMKTSGTHKRYFRAIDKAGNVSNSITVTAKIDLLDPTISFSIANEGETVSEKGSGDWYKKLWLKVSVTDSNSGVNTVKYCTTGETTCTPTGSAGNGSIVHISDSTGRKVCIQATDNAGQSVKKCSDTYKVDGTVPTISAFTITGSSGSSAGYSQTTSISAYSITASDATSSVASYCVVGSNDSSKCSWKSTVSGITKIALSGNDGAKTQYAFVKDEAGNISAVKSGKITLDTTNPTLSVSPGGGTDYTNSLAVKVSASDNIGLKSLSIRVYKCTSHNTGCVYNEDLTNSYTTGTDESTSRTVTLPVGYWRIYAMATDNSGRKQDANDHTSGAGYYYQVYDVNSSGIASSSDYCCGSGCTSGKVFNYTGKCTVTTGTNWTVKFTTSGTLTLKSALNVDAFLVGGGGGGAERDSNYGGSGFTGGGGGGGGYTATYKNFTLSATSYNVVIGAGGAAGGGNGGTTSIAGKTAAGGKGGTGLTGGAGGSGGGAPGWSYDTTASKFNPGGAGGSNGEDGEGGDWSSWSGLSGRAGGKGQGTTTGEFGVSTATKYGGGGGGGAGMRASDQAYGTRASGGTGGGGAGAGYYNTAVQNSVSGTANTGGGGGGGSYKVASAAGGSGIIIIRNKR